jgi:hypothetical protein
MDQIFATCRSEHCVAGIFRLNCLSILAAFCLLAPQLAHSQEAETAVVRNTPAETGAGLTTNPPARQPVESELTVEGLASYGHYEIFASGSGCHLYTGGVEYDRHSWGYFLRARMDYVGEFLPLVLLDAPITQDIWGTPTSPYHHIVPGIGISPIGFRLLWRDRKAIKPYLTVKGGILAFPQKVLSQKATYVDFSLQSAMGLQVRLTQRFDTRLGLFSDFHFSDDFIVPVNPGLDVMNANLGLTYHFGQRGK